MFINDLLLESHEVFKNKAIFVAGPPGSGKNTVANYFLSHYGFKNEDVDFVRRLLKLRHKPDDYDTAHQLSIRRREIWIQRNLPIIILGTGRLPEKIAELDQMLQEKGYHTMCIYVQLPYDQAWARVQDRARKEGRDVDPDYFHEVFEKGDHIQTSLERIFPNNFIQYTSDQHLRPSQQKLHDAQVQKQINRFLLK